jgi:hypothetical protein
MQSVEFINGKRLRERPWNRLRGNSAEDQLWHL